MREVLRSHTSKFEFDLNEDPVEDDGSSSKSPSRSSHHSTGDKVGSELDLDISFNAVDGGVEVTKGDKGRDFSHHDGEIPGGLEGNIGCALPLMKEGSVQKGFSESMPLEVSGDPASVDVFSVSAVGSVNRKNEATGKGRRGRKRKTASSGKSCAGGLDGIFNKEGNEEHDQDLVESSVCASSACNPVSVNQGLTEIRPLEDEKDADIDGARQLDAVNGVEIKDAEEDGRKHEIFASCEKADVDGSVAADPTGSTDECRQIPSKGRRGRKRKVLVASGGNNDNVDAVGEAKRLALDGSRPQIVGRVLRSRTREDSNKPQIVGRVLRSRTREANAAEMQVCAEEKVHGDSNCEVELGLSASRSLDMEIEESAWPAVKRSSGRPPAAKRGEKVRGDSNCVVESEFSASRNLDMQMEESARPAVKRGRGRPPAAKHVEKVHRDSNCEVELEPDASRNLDMEIEERARPAVKCACGRHPAAKRGRGRPPKLHVKNGSSKVTLRTKTKLVIHKEATLPGGNVVKGHKLLKLRRRKVESSLLKIHEENSIDKNEGLKPKEEKQLLKEQIIGILKLAGWTIEYRPRNGRDYLDAVYVDSQGRTHWSVTLAYQKLKMKIEDGTANEKEKSAFTPIPGDKLSKLFRVTQEGKKSKKGLKSGGIKSGARPDKKSAGERKSASKKKASMTFGPHCEQENSHAVSCTRKLKSRRKGSKRSCGPSAREPKDESYEGNSTLLSWMIDLGTVSLGDRVQYIKHERTDMTQGGKITREGICCDCCSAIFSPTDFEHHHAGNMLAQPLQNICLETGQSLLQCMEGSWRKQEEIHCISFNFVNFEDDPADDICNICADGGDLICCDGCPSTFHQSCLQIPNFPTGDWHCTYCSCKFCGMVCRENSLGDIALGPNLSKDNVPDSDYFGCFTCLFCEEKFHVSCALRNEDASIDTEAFQFCGSGCQKLSENLQKLLGVKHELEDGYSWTILRRQDLSCTSDPLKVESNSKLAVALSIIDECFTPIIDERSSINVIRNVCYSCGSNLKRINYTAFCTFILEKNDELVSAATIRVHGNKLAEMPFIGTRLRHRRKGMASRLLKAIEMALSSIDVEKLVIPAVTELRETWTKVFGFVPVEESRRQEMKYMSLVLFPKNEILEKPLCKDRTTNGNISAADMDSQPSKEHVNETNSPTDDASTADVGSGLHLNCNVSDPGCDLMNGLANPISSTDEHYHDLGTSEVKLETSSNGISEKNQVENISCAPEEAKEAMKSLQKAVVYSQ